MTEQDPESHDALARRDRYQRYIASSAWRNNPARLAELKASGMRCRICNASAQEAELQVHHRTYERLEHELPEDLTTLCANCHLDFTLILRGRQYASRTPRRADVPRPLVDQPKIPDPFHGEANCERLRFLALDRRPPAFDARRPLVRPAGSELARITGKRLKTASDHREIARVEWFGGLWLANGVPCIPAEAIEAAFIAGARMQRRGKQAAAGLEVDGPAKLYYDGPQDIDELWKQERFRLRVPVRVGTARMMRTRPRFDTWNVDFKASFLPSLLSPPLIADIFAASGFARGLGDWRPKFGRFRVECLD